MVVSPLKSSASSACMSSVNTAEHNKRIMALIAKVKLRNNLDISNGTDITRLSEATAGGTVGGDKITVEAYRNELDAEIDEGLRSLLIKKKTKKTSPPRLIDNSTGFVFNDNLYDWITYLESRDDHIGTALTALQYKFWKTKSPVPWNYLRNIWTQVIAILHTTTDPTFRSNILISSDMSMHFDSELKVMFERQIVKYDNHVKLFTTSGCYSSIERNMKSCCERVIKILINSDDENWKSDVFDSEYSEALSDRNKHRVDLISRNKSPSRAPACVARFKESIYDELSKPMFGKYGSSELVEQVAKSYVHLAETSINRMSMNAVFVQCKKLTPIGTVMNKQIINQSQQDDITSDCAIMKSISAAWKTTSGSFTDRRSTIGEFVSLL